MRKVEEFRELEGEEQKACAKSFFHTAKSIIDKANQSLKTIDSATGAVERLTRKSGILARKPYTFSFRLA